MRRLLHRLVAGISLSLTGCAGMSAVSGRHVYNLSATEISHEPLTVRVSGVDMGSGTHVSSVEVRREDGAVIVLVYLSYFWGTTGAFSRDVQVDDGINCILFGREKIPVWTRHGAGQAPGGGLQE
jgi:hypothetical protein